MASKPDGYFHVESPYSQQTLWTGKFLFKSMLLLLGQVLILTSTGFSTESFPPQQGMRTLTTSSKQNKMDNTNDKKSGNPYYSRTDQTKLNVSDAEWKRVLPRDLYEVARNKATERSFTGKYWDFTGKGTYYCAACGSRLFRSDAKFASECGWPSFFEQIDPKSIPFTKITVSAWTERKPCAVVVVVIWGIFSTTDQNLPGSAIA